MPFNQIPRPPVHIDGPPRQAMTSEGVVKKVTKQNSSELEQSRLREAEELIRLQSIELKKTKLEKEFEAQKAALESDMRNEINALNEAKFQTLSQCLELMDAAIRESKAIPVDEEANEEVDNTPPPTPEPEEAERVVNEEPPRVEVMDESEEAKRVVNEEAERVAKPKKKKSAKAKKIKDRYKTPKRNELAIKIKPQAQASGVQKPAVAAPRWR